ncbi:MULTISPECIES: sodium:calcium antiporter [unclassified Enterococcus]|uniref:sodium:calcium antiporter n=1 Tax=unclassified Enterococcus TaxID=2608891 RepID=UPI001555AE28|nr:MULTISPECIES: sodium:calcium antiporter [unclassified Enterococcus]MBS7577146.1 sodium:calcium antiporter [Enterococcus sp. MMGLQ5-2]MBS7584407.1 sodium:calcium antiporter [Enterococcus sp. MMGLQ5-1]NPD12262.1 sodium:calcium antiporter [Enterococcus sp. MMGLQ5-1]NPD36980.1 sodium:calcium antiporter [Enterococcus sp. MMGLQ5-2]
MDQLFTNSPLFIIIIVFLIALFILSKSADYLTDSAIIISKTLGISDIIIGATIVSLGTSLPEFATTITALLNGSNDLALGNALGSIITNTSIILGIGILYGKIPVAKKTAFNVWITFLCLISIYLISILNQAVIPRYTGYILLIILPIYLFYAFKKSSSNKQLQHTEKKKTVTASKLVILIAKVIFSALIVAVSSSFLVATVQASANRLGISEAIISATIVALGTSLPELSTVIVSAKKGHGGLAFGNLIGASLMNILLVLSTTISFSKASLVVPKTFLLFHFPIAVIIFLYLLYCIYNSNKHELTKKEGLFFIIIYLVYLLYNLLF